MTSAYAGNAFPFRSPNILSVCVCVCVRARARVCVCVCMHTNTHTRSFCKGNSFVQGETGDPQSVCLCFRLAVAAVLLWVAMWSIIDIVYRQSVLHW